MPRMSRPTCDTVWSWDQVVFYVAQYVGTIGVVWTDNLVYGLQVLAATFLARMLALSLFYHRYFAHKSFEVGRLMQFAMAFVGATVMQRGPIWWASTHRTHHRYADTENDLHSPSHRGLFYAHFGWFLDRANRVADESNVSDLLAYPELRVLEHPLCQSTIVGVYALFLVYVGGYDALVWGFFASTICTLQITHWIQSMSHSRGGYRRYRTRDRSRNHWLLGVISLGEYHNNHHYCPRSARQGVAWWELDVGYIVLTLLVAIGLARNVRGFHSR